MDAESAFVAARPMAHHTTMLSIRCKCTLRLLSTHNASKTQEPKKYVKWAESSSSFY